MGIYRVVHTCPYTCLQEGAIFLHRLGRGLITTLAPGNESNSEHVAGLCLLNKYGRRVK